MPKVYISVLLFERVLTPSDPHMLLKLVYENGQTFSETGKSHLGNRTNCFLSFFRLFSLFFFNLKACTAEESGFLVFFSVFVSLFLVLILHSLSSLTVLFPCLSSPF